MIDFKIEVLVNAERCAKSYAVLEFVEPDYPTAKKKAMQYVETFTTETDKVRYFVTYEIRDNETGERKSSFSDFTDTLP